jgi:hypothetical protein
MVIKENEWGWGGGRTDSLLQSLRVPAEFSSPKGWEETGVATDLSRSFACSQNSALKCPRVIILWLRQIGKVNYHTMKTYGEYSISLYLGTRWMGVASFTPRSLYPRFTLDRKLSGRHFRSVRCGVQRKITYPCRESKPGHPALRHTDLAIQVPRYMDTVRNSNKTAISKNYGVLVNMELFWWRSVLVTPLMFHIKSQSL